MRQSVIVFGCVTLLPALAGAATFRVNLAGGVDTASCGSEISPCATIQQAVNLAISGDTILVAQGTYVDNELCAIGGPPGLPTVVCVQKNVTILGGFEPSTDSWSVPNPSVNTTIIDGGNVRRGVIVNRPEGGLRMEGFTIQNCVAKNGGIEFGGGMWAVLIGEDLTLRDMVFLDNIAEAGTGMQAGGGGLAIQGDAANIVDATTLERVRFERNEARGGGVAIFGSGLGGGFHADHAIVTAFDVELIDNKAIGGADGDGLGGGASFSFEAPNVVLEKVLATGNTATGGANRFGFGGGFYLEGDSTQITQATITDANLNNNTAEGPSGAGGGGALSFKASLTLNRAAVIGNRAVGGGGATNAGGGGVFFWAPDVGHDPPFAIRNSIVAENVTEGATGGGGSGVRLLGCDRDGQSYHRGGERARWFRFGQRHQRRPRAAKQTEPSGPGIQHRGRAHDQ